MSEEPQPSQDSQEKSAGSNELKALIAKGIIGAIALAGTTAIPILVQKALDPPAPAASPVPITPAQVVPVPPTTTPLEATTPPDNTTPPEGTTPEEAILPEGIMPPDANTLAEPVSQPIPEVTSEPTRAERRDSQRGKGQKDDKDDD
jgi:hypothetical protein